MEIPKEYIIFVENELIDKQKRRFTIKGLLVFILCSIAFLSALFRWFKFYLLHLRSHS